MVLGLHAKQAKLCRRVAGQQIANVDDIAQRLGHFHICQSDVAAGTDTNTERRKNGDLEVMHPPT